SVATCAGPALTIGNALTGSSSARFRASISGISGTNVSPMSDLISVAVVRGGIVEAVHRVHAVAVDAEGKVVYAAGDPELRTFMRSSAKPIQALPLARTAVPLGDREVAIACASRLADPEQLAAVRTLLTRAEATEDDLVCGLEGVPPSRLNHNCSGNHAGMLVVCREHGWDIHGYGNADHPVQRALVA